MKSTLKRAATIIRALIGREILVARDVRCKTERFGSEFAGWDVAIDRLDSDAVVYSFGVGEDASFDVGLIERFGLTIHAFDPTPKSIEWVRQQDLPSEFVLHEYGIAAFDGEADFSPPENPEHVSHTLLQRTSTREQAISVQVRRLATIAAELGHDRIDVLKMDIEGAEYEVIRDLMKGEIRPGQILVEFHHRFPEVDVDETRTAIDRLRKIGYGLFAVSPSNEEFCFIHLGKA